MGQWVKAHVTMYDDLTLVLRTHMAGENCPLFYQNTHFDMSPQYM